jgi:site-specific DNA-methyltransferase (adenine-specific)
MEYNTIKKIDCIEGLKELSDNSVNVIVTSPPYNKKGLIGKNKVGNQIWGKYSIDYETYGDDMNEGDYENWMIEFLNECHRVLKPDGSFFFNHKPRRHNNQCFLPTDFISKSNVILYQLIIWNRKNSPNIRKEHLVPCTEHIYWFRKDKPKSYRSRLNKEYISEVWNITVGRQGDHPAPFPEILVENCLKLSSDDGDLVLDPFMGSGTTAKVASVMARNYLGFEIDEKYLNISLDKVINSKVSTLKNFLK